MLCSAVGEILWQIVRIQQQARRSGEQFSQWPRLPCLKTAVTIASCHAIGICPCSQTRLNSRTAHWHAAVFFMHRQKFCRNIIATTNFTFLPQPCTCNIFHLQKYCQQKPATWAPRVQATSIGCASLPCKGPMNGILCLCP